MAKVSVSKKKWIIICATIMAVVFTAVALVIVFETKRNKPFGVYYDMKCELFLEENKTAEEGKIVFLGDSITDLYDLDFYYPDLVAYNRGIGGDTTSGIINRLKETVLSIKPSIIVLLIGVNDISKGVADVEILDNYKNILEEIKKELPGCKVIIESIYPVNGDKIVELLNNIPHINAINIELQSLAADYSYTYIDVFSSLKNANDYLLNSAYSADGLHPNIAGYLVITDIIKAVLNSIK